MTRLVKNHQSSSLTCVIYAPAAHMNHKRTWGGCMSNTSAPDMHIHDHIHKRLQEYVLKRSQIFLDKSMGNLTLIVVTLYYYEQFPTKSKEMARICTEKIPNFSLIKYGNLTFIVVDTLYYEQFPTKLKVMARICTEKIS
jgi:hypothetical protein